MYDLSNSVPEGRPLPLVTICVTGTAGGLIDNTAETATFNTSSFKATKTELKALSGTAQWSGGLPNGSVPVAQRTGADGLLAPKARAANAGLILAFAAAAVLAQ